jgi:hypothetical protein
MKPKEDDRERCLTNLWVGTNLRATKRVIAADLARRGDFVQNITMSSGRFLALEYSMANPDDSNWPKFAAIGLEIAAGVGLGIIIGSWIDRKRNSAPWGILIGAGLGFAAGLYLLIKEANRVNRN